MRGRAKRACRWGEAPDLSTGYPQVIHKPSEARPNENDSHLHMRHRFYYKKQQITRKIIYRFYILFRLTSLFFYDSDFAYKDHANLDLKFAKFDATICLCQGNVAPDHFWRLE